MFFVCVCVLYIKIDSSNTLVEQFATNIAAKEYNGKTFSMFALNYTPTWSSKVFATLNACGINVCVCVCEGIFGLLQRIHTIANEVYEKEKKQRMLKIKVYDKKQNRFCHFPAHRQ